MSHALAAGAEEELRAGEAAGRATVLIVDAGTQNRRLLESLLRPEGYRTLSVAGGEAALASIAQRAPDLILLDLMVPGMDGCRLARILKADRATAGIPIIMVTQVLDRSARLAALEAGVEDFLVTPLDRAELWLRVRNLLRLKALGADYQDQNAELEQRAQARIAEHKQAELRIKRLNRVFAVHSQINALIVRMQGRGELFREICRIAVAEGGFLLARVIQFEPDGRASIAASTERDSSLFQRIVDEYNADPAQSNSMLALALRGTQPLVANDVANDPRIPNRAALTREGTYALALLPILVEKRVVGTLLLRAREKDMFDADELRLLLDVVSNLAFALELMDKRERINYLAYYDALTGLANRALFIDRLGQAISLARRHRRRFALLYLDLNRFKPVNDAFGHAAGDELLQVVAARIRPLVRDSDTVARIGGDEFTILLNDIGKREEAQAIAGKIEAALAAPIRLSGPSQDVSVGVSIGIALYPEDARDADALVSVADAAMYSAKQA